MATVFTFRVTGLAGVVAALQSMGIEVEDPGSAFEEIAQEGERLGAEAAPKLSGTLAGDIQGRAARGSAEIVAGLGASAPYAAVINFGWPGHNIEATGFMQTTETALTPRAVELLEQAINEQIRQRGIA